MPRSFPTLKTFYYLDHFEELTGFVRTTCAALLTDAEKQFLARFERLPQKARGLAVRLVNRQGLVFPVSKLKYDELNPMAETISLLEQEGLVRRPCGEDWPELLGCLPKPMLLQLLDTAEVPLRGKRSWAKERILELARAEVAFDHFEVLGGAGDWVVLACAKEFDYLQFLYFGRLQTLQSFTLRDLGLVRTRSEGGKKFKPRFSSPDEAQGAFFYARLREQLRGACGETLRAAANGIESWPEVGKADALARLGRKLEKAGERDAALGLYRKTNAPPARERRIRLLHAAGERDEARRELDLVLSNPTNDEELLFAEDFLNLRYHKKRHGALTRTLREAQTLVLDEAHRDRAEWAVAKHFTDQGIPTFRAENHFWWALFGMLFWDELQHTTANEFDTRPVQLLDGSFYQENAEAIEKKLVNPAPELITKAFAEHYREENGVFRWRKKDEAILVTFLKKAEPAAVATILRRLMADPHANRAGFPDLLQIREGAIRFIEVKAEGDTLRRNQLVQLDALQRAGFEVEVLRVAWGLDPQQEYVVVDVETTGGRAEKHRVTEIGAVKVRAGEVVGTFSTLLNPQSRIPPNIVRLTGITDEMVRDAPLFEEKSGEFLEFLGDAVFVGHNVRFDHAFIREEFARLGLRFKAPTLCTVVAMRKFFPGLPSYSLGNLCREFDIPLENHHRALDDAKATAHLLQMVNEKRSS